MKFLRIKVKKGILGTVGLLFFLNKIIEACIIRLLVDYWIILHSNVKRVFFWLMEFLH